MRKTPIVLLAVVAVAGALGVVAVMRSIADGIDIALPKLGPACTVRADGEVTLDSEQMANAATISAVGLRKGMPERAVVVALATAFQESKLENLAGGDRDSVGLFQQRPSQGWGTVEKIMDPRYASHRFYTRLAKVKGWEEMRVTDAAQVVQKSAFPEAYEKWADESAVLARALTGKATGAVECTVDGAPALRGAAASAALREGLKLDWGKGLDKVKITNDAAGFSLGVADASTGWRYAHWLVSHASTTGLERVRFGDREWSAPDGKWQTVTAGAAADRRKVVARVFA